MIIKIIFNIVAIALFTITLLKLIKKNDSAYLALLIMEFIGLIINFIELVFTLPFNIYLKILMYLLCIIIPGILLFIEKKKGINLPELFSIAISQILERKGRTEEAKTKISEFLKKYPNSQVALKKMAKFYKEEQNLDAAITEYLKVIDLNQKDLDSYYELSILLNQNKQNNKAIEILQEVLKQKPEYEEGSNLLGNILFEEERYKEAASVYMAALRFHPANYDLYYSLGMTYTMLNDFERAKQFYDKAAQINSLAYNAKLNLGQIALIYGELDEAENYFLEGSKGENVEAGCYYYLSEIALLKGDQDKAINYMRIAVELDSNVYNQMQKDPIFAPIRTKIPMPKKVQEQEKKKTSLSKKERKVNSHLVQTCILIEGLSNEDIEALRRQKTHKKEMEKEQKQRHEE